MRKFIIISSILILSILVIGCSKSYFSLKLGDNYQKGKFYKIHELSSDKIIYSEFPTIDVVVNNKKISLAQALKKKKITIEDIIAKMEFVTAANDGGSALYKFDTRSGDLANKDFMLAICNVINGKKDIYFGTTIEVIINCNVSITN